MFLVAFFRIMNVKKYLFELTYNMNVFIMVIK